MARSHVAARCLVGVLTTACTGTSSPRTTAPAAGASRADSVSQRLLTMTVHRAVQHATRLIDGRVLLSGGCTEPGCGGFDRGAVSEIYTPATHSFETGPRMQALEQATRPPC